MEIPNEAYVIKEDDYTVPVHFGQSIKCSTVKSEFFLRQIKIIERISITLPAEGSVLRSSRFTQQGGAKERKFRKGQFDKMKNGHKKYLSVNTKPGVLRWFSI